MLDLGIAAEFPWERLQGQLLQLSYHSISSFDGNRGTVLYSKSLLGLVEGRAGRAAYLIALLVADSQAGIILFQRLWRVCCCIPSIQTHIHGTILHPNRLRCRGYHEDVNTWRSHLIMDVQAAGVLSIWGPC